MISLITLIVLIVLAVIFLIIGIVNAVKYGKMTGAKAKDTKDKPLPTAMGSATDNMEDRLSGYQFVKKKTIYKTKGKEVEFNFSLSYDEMRRGLKSNDPVVTLQFYTFMGFTLFAAFTMAAIGTGILKSGNAFGYVFIAAGAGLVLLFAYKMLTADSAEPGSQQD